MQLPVHLVTNSPTSLDTLPPAFRESSSNILLPVVPPGPEETKRRNESPHPQEDSRGQRTVIRPHGAEQVDRTSSIQSSVTPSASYPSSSERTNRPHAEKVNRVASIQPSTKPIPSSPPFSLVSSERNVTRPHADPVNRTASSSVQLPIKPSAPYLPTSSSSERNVVRPRAELVSRNASVKPPAKAPTPSPSLDRSSTSISPSLSPPAPALAKIASSRVHPLVDRGNVRSDEQARNDPSSSSRRPPAPPEHTHTTTKPPRQDYKDPPAVSQRLPEPPEHTPPTSEPSSRKVRRVPSATSDRPSVPSKSTPAMAMSPPFQDSKETSAASSMLPALPKPTATTGPPSDSLSQSVSGPGDLNKSKSGIRGNDGSGSGAEQAMGGSPSLGEEQNLVPTPERENRLKDSANVRPNPTSGHARDVLQYSKYPSESPLQRTYSSHRNRGHGHSAPYPPDTDDSQPMGLPGYPSEQPAASMPNIKYHSQSPATGPPINVHLKGPAQEEPSSVPSPIDNRGHETDPVRHVPMRQSTGGNGPRTHVAGDESQKAQQRQTPPDPEIGDFVGARSPSTSKLQGPCT